MKKVIPCGYLARVVERAILDIPEIVEGDDHVALVSLQHLIMNSSFKVTGKTYRILCISETEGHPHY